MGVRHLETFVKESVPNGFIEVSLNDECERFRENNGSRPTLVIDLMGLTYIICQDNLILLCGGRHDQYNLQLQSLLKKLSVIADLVFFSDGSVVDDKFETWAQRQNDKYDKTILVMENVRSKVPLQTIVSKLGRKIPRGLSNLPMTEAIAAKYGKLFITVTRECDAELARYANNNKNVLAVLADDTDFLIFSGLWRYFSLNKLNINKLTTMEYSRVALRGYLGLNDEQMVIFSSLGGNDIVKYDDVWGFHSRVGHSCDEKFPFFAGYIKKLPTQASAMVEKIAQDIFQDSSQCKKNILQKSFDQYDTNFDLADYSSDPLLFFCRRNHFDFTFSILIELPKNLTINYYDFRSTDFPNFSTVAIELFRKQIGILLQHRDGEIQYEIRTKKSHVEGFKRYYVTPNYPEIQVPPLLQLLDRQTYPEHDEIRFKLLKWTIDENMLQPYDLSSLPKECFLDVLSLVFLKSKGFITTEEADMIMASINMVQKKSEICSKIRDSLSSLGPLNERAFRISFLFAKIHQTIYRSVEVTGLEDSMTKLLNFDGVVYNVLNLRSYSPGFTMEIPESYRLYK